MILPDGYEDAIKWNLAIRAAALYPWEAKLDPIAHKLAAQALNRLKVLNTSCPTLRSEAEFWVGGMAGIGPGCSPQEAREEGADL